MDRIVSVDRLSVVLRVQWELTNDYGNGCAAMILSSFSRDGPWILMSDRAWPSDKPYRSARVCAV
ncbi:protein of unknown function [Aminobacter niigataensis]|nr:protein of unknown function [Aminobacter niigataensis]